MSPANPHLPQLSAFTGLTTTADMEMFTTYFKNTKRLFLYCNMLNYPACGLFLLHPAFFTHFMLIHLIRTVLMRFLKGFISAVWYSVVAVSAFPIMVVLVWLSPPLLLEYSPTPQINLYPPPPSFHSRREGQYASPPSPSTMFTQT